MKEKFIEKATEVHKGKYTYEKVNYINNKTKVTITCSLHGDFQQTPSCHVYKKEGCPICAKLSGALKQRSTLETFITKAKEVHKDFYIYDKTLYKNSASKVLITCPIHGDFEQLANGHLQGRGCLKCSHTKYKYTTDTFVKRANEVHSGKYTYENTMYLDAESFVTITCPVHGDFQQRAKVHIHGSGCTECANVNRGSWTKDNWKLCETSTNFESFKLYVIKCWNDEETFYKIGRTATYIHHRFAPSRLPYSWKLVYLEEGSSDYIYDLEKHLHKAHKELKYTPIKVFDGYSECFSDYIL